MCNDLILGAEGVPGAEIHQRLSALYENSAWPKQSVYEWTDQFQNSSTGVTDAEWWGNNPHTQRILNKSMPWLWVTEGQLMMKWQIICKSVMFWPWNHPQQTMFSSSLCKVGLIATHKWPHVQMLGYLPALFQLGAEWIRQLFHKYHHWGRDVDPLLRSRGQMPEYGLEKSQSPSKMKFKMQPTARRVIFYSQQPVHKHYEDRAQQ